MSPLRLLAVAAMLFTAPAFAEDDTVVALGTSSWNRAGSGEYAGRAEQSGNAGRDFRSGCR